MQQRHVNSCTAWCVPRPISAFGYCAALMLLLGGCGEREALTPRVTFAARLYEKSFPPIIGGELEEVEHTFTFTLPYTTHVSSIEKACTCTTIQLDDAKEVVGRELLGGSQHALRMRARLGSSTSDFSTIARLHSSERIEALFNIRIPILPRLSAHPQSLRLYKNNRHDTQFASHTIRVRRTARSADGGFDDLKVTASNDALIILDKESTAMSDVDGISHVDDTFTVQVAAPTTMVRGCEAVYFDWKGASQKVLINMEPQSDIKCTPKSLYFSRKSQEHYPSVQVAITVPGATEVSLKSWVSTPDLIELRQLPAKAPGSLLLSASCMSLIGTTLPTTGVLVVQLSDDGDDAVTIPWSIR